jgi:hypothetical protein
MAKLDKNKELLADRLIREAAEKEATEQAAKEAAEKEATEQAAKEAAEKEATEQATKKTLKEKVKEATEELKKEAAKGLNKDVADFFTQYPKAPKVLKVGDCLFLATNQGAAVEYSKRMETQIEEIANPNL